MNPETLHSTLDALRNAGSVFGVLFSKGSETLFSDLAYTPERIEDLAHVLDDITYYFEQEGRSPEILSFSYDGGSLLLTLRRGHRLVVLHHHADEVDFLASACGAFLKDFFASEAAESFQGAAAKTIAARPPGGSKPPKQPVDPTSPINPAGAV
ncbi:MAG: hypothetical protein AAGC68_03505 [Verrucomicrobiota bacterium]